MGQIPHSTERILVYVTCDCDLIYDFHCIRTAEQNNHIRCILFLLIAVCLCNEPEHQLFLWCVLMRRKDLAMCFWEEGNVSSH